VALKVLDAAQSYAVPTGTQDYAVGDIRVSVEDLTAKKKQLYNRLLELEEEHFPTTQFPGMAFY